MSFFKDECVSVIYETTKTVGFVFVYNLIVEFGIFFICVVHQY